MPNEYFSQINNINAMTSNLIQNQNYPASPSSKTKALRELMGPESNDEDRSKLACGFDPHFISLLNDSQAISSNFALNGASPANQCSIGDQCVLNCNEKVFVGDLANESVGCVGVNKGNEVENEENDKKKQLSAYFTSVKKLKKKAKPSFQIVDKFNVKDKEDNSSFIDQSNNNNIWLTDNNEQNKEEKSNDNDNMFKVKDSNKNVKETSAKPEANTDTKGRETDDITKQLTNKNERNANGQLASSLPHNFKEHYLDQLILAAEKLFSQGLITLDYLIEPVTDNKSKKEVMKCDNRLCKKIISDSSNKFDTLLNTSMKVVSLCGECYEAKEAGHYCHYCNAIYLKFKEPQGKKDKKGWIQCDSCHKWQHIQCEMRKGTHRNLLKPNNDRFKYTCPLCRKANKEGQNGQTTVIKHKRKRDKDSNDDSQEVHQKENGIKPNAISFDTNDLELFFKEIEEREVNERTRAKAKLKR